MVLSVLYLVYVKNLCVFCENLTQWHNGSCMSIILRIKLFISTEGDPLRAYEVSTLQANSMSPQYSEF